MRHIRALVPAALAALALTACSSGTPSGGSGTADGKVAVWATTSVWGSIAQAVGGEHVAVTSAITRSDQDPHDYEVTARDKVEVDKAAVAVVNGGGYDDWAVDLVTKAPDKPAAVNAVELSGLQPASSTPTTSAAPDPNDPHAGHHHGEFNEHVFYSLPTVKKVAAKIATDLGAKDPAHAAVYTKNAQAFEAKVDGLITRARGIGTAAPGTTAISTEPVAGYLLASAGVDDITPEAFVTGSDSSAGPSVAALQETTQLLTSKKAKLLVLNAQTQDDASKRLTGAAASAGIPTVSFSETFPDGVTDYVAWIDSSLTSLSGALGKK